MKIKLRANEVPRQIRLENAETGEEIRGVRSLQINYDHSHVLGLAKITFSRFELELDGIEAQEDVAVEAKEHLIALRELGFRVIVNGKDFWAMEKTKET